METENTEGVGGEKKIVEKFKLVATCAGVLLSGWEDELETQIKNHASQIRAQRDREIAGLLDWTGKGFHSGSEVVTWMDNIITTLKNPLA